MENCIIIISAIFVLAILSTIYQWYVTHPKGYYKLTETYSITNVKKVIRTIVHDITSQPTDIMELKDGIFGLEDIKFQFIFDDIHLYIKIVNNTYNNVAVCWGGITNVVNDIAKVNDKSYYRKDAYELLPYVASHTRIITIGGEHQRYQTTFHNADMTKNYLDSILKRNKIGEGFRVDIPIKVNGEDILYSFTFTRDNQEHKFINERINSGNLLGFNYE